MSLDDTAGGFAHNTAGRSVPEIERKLLREMERAGSRDKQEEAAMALAEYYLDTVRPLEALSLFERISSATADARRREFSDYFLRRLDGKRIEDIAGAEQRGSLEEVLEQMFYIYLRMGNSALAARYLQRIVAVTDDPDVKANCLLSLGELNEKAGDYGRAVANYAAALRLPPGGGETWYLVNRNMARCLNVCGRFREAEGYCRRAIAIDPARRDVRTILAASLKGQGRHAQAARCDLSSPEP